MELFFLFQNQLFNAATYQWQRLLEATSLLDCVVVVPMATVAMTQRVLLLLFVFELTKHTLLLLVVDDDFIYLLHIFFKG